MNAFCNETMEVMARLHVSPVHHFVSENWDLDCLQFDTALVKRWHIFAAWHEHTIPSPMLLFKGNGGRLEAIIHRPKKIVDGKTN